MPCRQNEQNLWLVYMRYSEQWSTPEKKGTGRKKKRERKRGGKEERIELFGSKEHRQGMCARPCELRHLIFRKAGNTYETKLCKPREATAR